MFLGEVEAVGQLGGTGRSSELSRYDRRAKECGPRRAWIKKSSLKRRDENEKPRRRRR